MTKLTGKNIVFTGKLESMTRDEAAAIARALGATVGTAVTKSTDILVAGPGAGSKIQDAAKHGVKVIDEQAWAKLKNAALKESTAKKAHPEERAGNSAAAKKTNTKEVTTDGSAKTALAGKTIVFTGKLEQMTREQASVLAKALGAVIAKSITSSTDILVAGPGAGSKLEEARKHHVKVIDEKAWMKLALTKPAANAVPKSQELPEPSEPSVAAVSAPTTTPDRARSLVNAKGAIRVPSFERQVKALCEYTKLLLGDEEEVDTGVAKKRISWMMGFPDPQTLQACVKANEPWRQVNEPAPILDPAHPEYVKTQRITVDDIRALRPDLTRCEAWESLLATLIGFSKESGYELCYDSLPRALKCRLLGKRTKSIGLPCVVFLGDGDFLPVQKDGSIDYAGLPDGVLESCHGVRIDGVEEVLPVTAGKLFGGNAPEVSALVDRLASEGRLPRLPGNYVDPPPAARTPTRQKEDSDRQPLAYIPGHHVPAPGLQVRQLQVACGELQLTLEQAEEAVARVMGFSSFEQYEAKRQREQYPLDAPLTIHWTIEDIRSHRADLTKAEAAGILDWAWDRPLENQDENGLSYSYFEELIFNDPSPWPDMMATAHWEARGAKKSAKAVLNFSCGVVRVMANAVGQDKLEASQRGFVTLNGVPGQYAFGPDGPKLLKGEIMRMIDALESERKLPER